MVIGQTLSKSLVPIGNQYSSNWSYFCKNFEQKNLQSYTINRVLPHSVILLGSPRWIEKNYQFEYNRDWFNKNGYFDNQRKKYYKFQSFQFYRVVTDTKWQLKKYMGSLSYPWRKSAFLIFLFWNIRNKFTKSLASHFTWIQSIQVFFVL